MRRGSSTDHHTVSIPFSLSPLNEFDEEYENPLNKGMIIESTVSGFLWSKKREECCPGSNLHQDLHTLLVNIDQSGIHSSDHSNMQDGEEQGASNKVMKETGSSMHSATCCLSRF